jgi:gliding motility-associated-like protein
MALSLSSYSQNLILNPSCEDNLIGGQIPYWRQVIGSGWTQRSGTQPAAAGIQYFYAGSVPVGELAQTLDLSADSVVIDMGAKKYRFYASTLSYPQSPPDQSIIYIDFADRAGTVLSSVMLGPYSTTTYWLRTDTNVAAPVGTRSVDIRLHSVRRTGTSNDGFYDDLFFGRPTVYDTIDTVMCFGSSIYGYAASGTYVDTFSTAQNTDSVRTLHLTIRNALKGDLTKAICAGQSYDFFGQSISTSGTYQHVLTGTGGCDSAVSLHLRIVSFFDDSFSYILCPGSVVAAGSHMVSAAGVYRDTFSSIGGCDSMVTSVVSMAPTYSFTISRSICHGDSTAFGGRFVHTAGLYPDSLHTVTGCDSIETLDLSVSPVSADTIYQTICSGSSVLFGSQVITRSGVYTQTLTNAYGCDSTITLFMTMLPTPVAGFEISPTAGTVRVGIPISIIDLSAGADTLIWSLNGLSIAVDSATPLPVSDTGLYCIRQIAATHAGCRDSSVLCVTIFGSDLYIPDVFTPNGDGVNDFFEVFGSRAGMRYVKMSIYDRWGEKVFESSDLDFRWDGKYLGQALTPGVYVYTLDLSYADGQTVTTKGSLLLMR